jgi:hypothetical protein
MNEKDPRRQETARGISHPERAISESKDLLFAKDKTGVSRLA